MNIAKPINISIETFVYLVILYASYSGSIEKTILGHVDGFLVLGGFFFFIFLISLRAVISKREDRMLASTALFGFFVGSVMWSLFVWVETRSEGLTVSVITLIYIILTGVCVAALSMLTSYLVIRFLRMMRVL